MDTILNWAAFLALAWCVTAGCGWWPGPIAVMTSAVSRHRSRWSDHEDISDEDTDPDVMTPPEPPGALGRTVTLRAPLTGPRPLHELRGHHGPEDDQDDTDGEDEDIDDDEDDDDEPRRDWVARHLRAGYRPGWIDDHGARRYQCTPRTIARDREALTKSNQQRTMGGGR